MKYREDIIQKLEETLEDGGGRVRAVKNAGISYRTFLNWLNDNNKFNFFNRIKKAEEIGNDQVKDICKRRIIEDKKWQSAAWWLERNFPDEFRDKQYVEHGGGLNITTSARAKKKIDEIGDD